MEDVGFKQDLIDVENSERGAKKGHCRSEVGRERLGDGVAILGGGGERGGGGQGLYFWHRDE